ncbi:reverse transcriptase domain-containing protein [Tanacetum coccineum]
MKLNPKNCTFGAVEGMFLEYTITPEGIKLCLDKTEAVLQLPSPRTIKEVHKKSDFHWTPKAEQAFKQLKQHLSEQPLLVAPKPKEELIIYLSASYGAVSVVLITERGTIQTPDYFISRALQGPELNYTQMEKLVLLLDFAAKRLRGTSVKGQILADFLVEKPDENPPDTSAVETPPEPWILFTNGSSCVDRLGAEYEALIAGLRIAAQMGVRNIQLYALIQTSLGRGTYRKINTREGGDDCGRGGPTWMTSIMEYLKDGTLPDDRKEARPRSVVAKAMRLGYYWPTMHRDARDMIRTCNDCQVHRPIPRRPQQPLTPITALWPFYKWGIDIAGPFPEGPGKVKFLIVAMDYFTKWIEAKAMAKITGNQEKKFAHRTMIKSSHGDTPFSLTYGTEAVIPAKIGMPTYHTATVDTVHNDEELRLNLDLLEEKPERAAICEAKAKMKMTKYYNARVCGVAFRPRDFVYRSNDASHAASGGKHGPK